MFVNTLCMPSVVRLIPREEFEQLDPADFAYPDELYPMEGTPYAVTRGPLLSPLGAPCNPPPWGVMSAVDLVKSNKKPSEQDVRDWLEGNMCRCTGYHNIVKAIQAGAEKG